MVRSGSKTYESNKITEQLKAGWGHYQLTQRRLIDTVVQFAVSSNFSEEQGHCGDADHGQRGHRIFDLPLNLILRRTNTKKVIKKLERGRTIK